MTAPRSLTEAWSLDLSPATTSAPFITLLRDALLPAENFNTWLYNDYIYVHAHTHLLAQLIAALPAASHLHPLLTGGYTALNSELSLFRAKASTRGVPLPDLPAPHPDPAAEAAGRSPADVLAALAPAAADGCRRYMAFLMGLCTTAHWTALLAVLWVCERVYLDAMVCVRGGAAFADGRLDAGIRGFVEWWSSSEFVEYVEALEREAVGVRGGVAGWREEETKALVMQVVQLEVGFWGIAMEDLRIGTAAGPCTN